MALQLKPVLQVTNATSPPRADISADLNSLGLDPANLVAVKRSHYAIVALDMKTSVEYLNVSYTDVTAVDLRHVDAHVGLAFSGDEYDIEEFPAETASGVRVLLDSADTLAGFGAFGGKRLWHRRFESIPKVFRG